MNQLSKILTATGAINYMASQIFITNQELHLLASVQPEGLAKDAVMAGVNERNDCLQDAIKKLAEVMEDLGNLMDGHDMDMPIDGEILNGAFDVVVHRKEEEDEIQSDLSHPPQSGGPPFGEVKNGKGNE